MIFHRCKNGIQMKIFDFFFDFLIFLVLLKIPCKPQCFYIRVGCDIDKNCICAIMMLQVAIITVLIL